MKKKKKIIKLAILILVIIVTIIIISKLAENKNNNIKRLANIYEQLNTTQTYFFEMEENNDNKTIMAKKDNKTIIDHYTEDSHRTTIVKDNITYLVLHDREEYYVYEQNNVEQTILIEGLNEIISKEFTTGKEKVKGKKYTYEEYVGSTMFMSGSVANEEEIRTRFYFDNDNNLVYIQTINGIYQELLKINITKEVDDSLFEIPSHYAEN